MADEKRFEDLTIEELRSGVAEYMRAQQQTSRPPDAPGCESLSDKAREGARDAYTSHIMNKPAGQISETEREFLRQSIAFALKEGY
jgi:hypothetical protein